MGPVSEESGNFRTMRMDSSEREEAATCGSAWFWLVDGQGGKDIGSRFSSITGMMPVVSSIRPFL